VAPQPTAIPDPGQLIQGLASIDIPSIDPGAPVADPAIGATGDDNAEPQPFDPLASEAGVVAATQNAVSAMVIAAGVAAAAAAAARASSSRARRLEDSADSAEDAEVTELEVAHDNLTLDKAHWGDKLAIFALPFMTFLDRRSHRAAERIAPVSPLIAKIINDAAYLRALFGSLTLITPIAAGIIAAFAATTQTDVILTPSWQALLAIAILGIFDASAGFVAALTFTVGSIIAVGHLPGSSEIRTLMGIMVVAIGPALLTTAFRTLRKHAANDAASWWERLADFAIAPFMAGWSMAAMISTLPSLAGFTLAVANHVNDFALAIAAAAIIRVALEEFTARYYPARLNRINPDEIPDAPLGQKAFALAVKFGIWVFLGNALIGPSWQVWVGSFLFLAPAILSWFADRFPNSPFLWRVLPSGVPGLALSLGIGALTTSLVGAALGANPSLAAWSFVILALPLLALSILGLFGRHGATEDEEKPAKRFTWLYRIGGVVMLVVTLKLAGVI
jgi:hypothetical protein